MLLSKNAVITGGARGIGFAIAKELTGLRCKLVICSRTKLELQKALLDLNRSEKIAYGIVCDISKLSECRKLFRFAKEKLGSIDILVNNAGIYGPIGPFKETNLNKWYSAMKINFLGMVFCSHEVIPLMEKNGGGKIINLCGAGVGAKTLPRFSSYFTSKIA